MSGIFALLHPPGRPHADMADRALANLADRGPDTGDVWRDHDAGIVLGHTRQLIQDRSVAGKQPMVSASGRFVVVLGGEIYNHLELRAQLEAERQPQGGALPWRGRCDTETFLACIEHWGLAPVLERASGMFAVALWDREQRELTLIRDRVGEKPLYYCRVDGRLLVASRSDELAIMAGRPLSIDRRAVSLVVRFGAIPAPLTIYREIAKLEPARTLVVRQGDLSAAALPAPRMYWDASALAHEHALHQRNFASDEEAVDALQDCLAAAVRRQMIADAPIGAFLSGGIDSSLIVSLMQAEARARGAAPVSTFALGFRVRGYDEAMHARRVAESLGTRHHELYVSDAECLSVVSRLASIYDEPFADSSQIGTCLATRLAAGHVAVALTGDAGDEVFAGYNRYTRAARLWRRMERLPTSLRRAMAAASMSTAGQAAVRVADRFGHLLPGPLRPPRVGDRLEKIARMLASADAREMYLGMVEYWDPDELMLVAAPSPTTADGEWPRLPTLEEQMMLADFLLVLPTDMLPKVDRAAEAAGLEARVPFLDPAVIAFSWSLPLRYKIRDGQGKWLLRQLLYRHVPRPLVERPKMGFESPVARWLRESLRDWAEALLDERVLREQGYFRPEAVRAVWHSHLAGRADHSDRLWSVLAFQAWLASQGAAAERPAD